ncbi:transglycosylase SLT domain-containing protein [Streptomyces sp. NPDC012769]|uniref:transglycosylase SLT domain-containing protein n=1 Tax=Streptomyces sp. NPDC012769 TaxID=3364848 RepID=UPI00367E3AB5
MATITSLGFSIFSRYNGDGVNRARRDLQNLQNQQSAWARDAARMREEANRNAASWRNLTNQWQGANRQVRSLASGMGASRTALLGLKMALLPIAEVALATAAGLAAMTVASGAAVGAYAAVGNAAAKMALATAASGKALTAAEAQYVKAYREMQKAWVTFVRTTGAQTLKPQIEVIKGLTTGIQKMGPVINAIHPIIMKVATAFRQWMQGVGFERFRDGVLKYGVPAFDRLQQAGRNALTVLGIAYRTFLPMSDSLSKSILKGSEALKKWAQDGGFQRFLERARENTPKVVELLRNLWQVVEKIIDVLRQMAPVALEAASRIAEFISKIPTPVLVAAAAAFIGLKMALSVLLQPLMMVRLLMGPSGLFGVLGRVLPMALRFAGILGIVAGAIKLAWDHSEFFRDKVKQLWEVLQRLWREGLQPLVAEFRKLWVNLAPVREVLGQIIGFILGTVIMGITKLTEFITFLVKGIVDLWQGFNDFLTKIPGLWNTVWNGIKMVAETVWNGLRTAWDAVVNALKTAWDTVSSALKTAWDTVWNGIKTAAQTVWDWLKQTWQTVVDGLRTAWDTVSSALKTAWDTVWNGIKTAAQTVWDWLKQTWQTIVDGLKTAWDAVSGALKTAWDTVWNGIKTAAQTVWDWLKQTWQTILDGLKTAWDTVSGALKTAWDTVWNGIKTAAETVWNALKTAWDTFLNAVKTAWDTVSSAVKTAWDTVWNGIKTAAETVWNALKTAWDTFLNAVKTAWDTVSAALKTAWETVWNAVKTAAETVWNALKTAWDTFLNAVKTVWDTTSAALKTAWETVWNWIKDTAQKIWDGVKGAWEKFTGSINDLWNKAGDVLKKAWQGVWDWLKETAQKVWSGIGDVIERAINGILRIVKKIVEVWNGIAGAVSLDKLKIDTSGWSVDFNFAAGGIVEFANGGIAGGTPNFKAGGVLSGYAPGRDTVPAMLSRGEGVLVPEAVKGLGPNFVHAANYHFSHGRGGKNVGGGYEFAKGGIARGCELHGFAHGGIAKSCELAHYAGGGIVAFGRDPRNEEGWGTSFFAPGGIAGAADPDNPGIVGPGGIITGGEASTNPDAKDVGNKSDDKSIFERSGLGVISDGLGNAIDTGQMILGFIGRAAIEGAFNFASGALDSFGVAGDFGKILAGGVKKLLKGLIEKLVSEDNKAKEAFEAMSVAGAKSVQAWAPLAAKAIQMGGLDKSQLQAFLALMSAESGGNPNAINRWDINAKNGVPSQGLMQVIPTTFAANHVPGTSRNILDPLANMAAAARYIKNRYGGKVPGSPYADGTTNATAGLHLVGEEGPELVTSPGYANFGGGETVYNATDTAAIMSGDAAPRSGIEASLKNRSFEDIIAAAKRMAAAVKVSWNSVVTASTYGWSGLKPVLGEVASGHGMEVPSSMEAMRAKNVAAWMDMNLQSAMQWALMRDTTLAEAELHQGTMMPASTLTMQTASSTAWTDMGLQSSTQWGLMRDTTFAESNLMQTETAPTAASTMQTASNTAWTDMGLQSSTEWGLMRDTTFAESSLMQTDTMPMASTTMQTASDSAWTSMQSSSDSAWTGMNETAFTPFESTMSTEIPGAAHSMNTNVSSESRTMSQNVIGDVNATVPKVEQLISTMKTAISIARELAMGPHGADGGAAWNGGSAAWNTDGGGMGAGQMWVSDAEYAEHLEAENYYKKYGTGGPLAGIGAVSDAEYAEHLEAENYYKKYGTGGPLAGGDDADYALQREAEAYYLKYGTGGPLADPSYAKDWEAELAYKSGYAIGTPGASPGMHLVGELGPELINFQGGETVTPHRETAQILSGAMPSAPELPASGLPELGALQPSAMMAQLQNFGSASKGEGWFGDIISAAEHMMEATQIAWDGTVTAGVSATSVIDKTVDRVSKQMGKTIPVSLEKMAASSQTNWTAMNVNSAAQWAAMRDSQFLEAETHQGTTMPAKSVAMRTAHDLAWTTMNATSLAQWTLMRDEQFADAELHQGTTMPEKSVAMQTAHDLAWTTMNATSLAQWTIMRDTQFLEAETHQGTTMPEKSVAMQTAHDLAWTTMNTTSATEWTAIRDNQFVPFETHMSTTMPEAAQTMNEAVGAAFTEMASTVASQLDSAIAKIDEFIAKTEAAIAAAEKLKAAQAAAASSGGGGAGGNPTPGMDGGSDLQAALARAGNPQIFQGPYSNSVAASAGTHSGGGVVDVPVSAFDAMIAAGFIGWVRNWPGNEHAHMILPGTPDLSPQAAWQVQDYYAGGDGLNIPGNLARGTSSAMRGWTWVGENGPELLRMRGGEQVMPWDRARKFFEGTGRRRGRPWNDGDVFGDIRRRAFTASIEGASASVKGTVHRDHEGVHVEINFNGPVSNAAEVRRGVDEALPKIRQAIQAGIGRR